MARKQVLRALPADWPVSITEADDGRKGLEAIRSGLGQVVLLDLTMPEMDGYQVLAAMQAEGLQAFRETVNVAIGRAAALIAKVLGVFVQLPVPNVNILEVGELHMALMDAGNCQQLTAICQGFIGAGIAGEALLMFHDSEIADMAQLLKRQGPEYSDLEMLLDLSSVLIGACLSSIAEQIDVVFSQGHPQILGQHAAIEDLIRVNQLRWKKTLAVEISYSLEGHDIHFDLLLLFTEDSIERLTHKLAYLMT